MKNRKPLFGVGINDADYPVRITERYLEDGKIKSRTLWFCPYYRRWSDMLKRCYCKDFIKRNVTYNNCEVCDEWLIFSNFKKWMEKQDWKGNCLDKDFLGSGKLYSKETCRFISNNLNTFITPLSRIKKGDLPLGVSLDKRRGKYKAEIKVNNKSKFLGYFTNSDLAHKSWQKAKIEAANQFLEKEEDLEIRSALKKLIFNLNKDLIGGKETCYVDKR